MLKRAGKLHGTVLKEVNKAKKSALEDPAVDSASALETALAEVFSWNDRIAKSEGTLVSRVERKCAPLESPAAVFPGECADQDLRTVESCAIAAARCQACATINAFDALSLNCDLADDRSANGSCL
jgi:hypothetical protein